MMDCIENRLKKIIGSTYEIIVPIDNINTESSISELGVNSISFIKLVVAIENEFKIEFDDENLDYNKYKTIKDIISYIKSIQRDT